MKENSPGKQYLFDKPENVKRFMLGFYIALIVFIVADLLIHKHTSFPWEEYPFFHAAFGFVSFVVMIIAGKYILRPFVKRKEEYYD